MRLGKLPADERIKAHAAGAEEGVLVDDAIVQVVDVALVDDVNRLVRFHGQHEMTRQAVARPARDDAQCRVRLDDGTGHLVHRTVTPYSHHDVRTLVFGLLCNDRGMAAILGVNDFIVKQILVELRLDDLPDARFLHCARNGIDDEYDMSFVAHAVQK